MSVTRIASRYAKSLLDLSREEGKLDAVLKDINAFQQAAQQRDFWLMLKSPIINPGKKAAILKEIFGGKMDDLTMNFLNISVRKGREEYLPEIADEFVKQYRELKSISTVKVTTATPLSESGLAAIKKQLLNSDQTAENVKIETAVNADIIGGFVIEFNDKLYDASVAHKLKQLRKQFT